MKHTRDFKVKYLNKYYPIKKFFKDSKQGTQKSCPFHDDKNPSAKIYENDNILRCFCCGRAYFVINFITKYNLSVDKLFDEIYNPELNQTEIIYQKNNVDPKGKSFEEYTKEFFDIK
jgi:DNA primase